MTLAEQIALAEQHLAQIDQAESAEDALQKATAIYIGLASVAGAIEGLQAEAKRIVAEILEETGQSSVATAAGKATLIQPEPRQRIASLETAMKLAETNGDVATALSIMGQNGLIFTTTRTPYIMIEGT